MWDFGILIPSDREHRSNRSKMRCASEVRRAKDGRRSWGVADVVTRVMEMRNERASVPELLADTSPVGRAGPEIGMGVPSLPITKIRTASSRSIGERQGSTVATANQRSSDRLRLTLPALSTLNSKAMTKRGQLLQRLSDRLLQDDKFLSEQNGEAGQIDYPTFKRLVTPHLGQDLAECDQVLLGIFQEIAKEKKVKVDVLR